jgi:hypothetical protein
LDNIGGNFNKFGHLFFGDFIHQSSARPLMFLLISWSSAAPSPGVSPPHSEHFPQCAECPLPDEDACVQPDLFLCKVYK